MQLAARIAAWAKSGGGVPTARDYVAGANLILDGVENAGYGVHLPSLTKWTNIVTGEQYPIAKANYRVDGDGMVFNEATSNENYSYVTGETAVPSSQKFTVEIVVKDYDMAKFNRLFARWLPGAYGVVSDASVAGCRMTYNFMGYFGYGMVANWISTTNFDVPCPPEMTFAVIVDGSAVVGYCNGELIGSTTTSFLNPSESVSWMFPGWYYPWSYLEAVFGKYCGFRIYNRALTADEIAANYAIDKARFGLT